VEHLARLDEPPDRHRAVVLDDRLDVFDLAYVHGVPPHASDAGTVASTSAGLRRNRRAEVAVADGSPVDIALEDDPTPLVRILGATLRRAARRPELESRLAKMRGVVALKSSVDPQAVTMRFANGSVLVEHGVAVDSGVVIETDL